MKSFEPDVWHNRFNLQAKWTAGIRERLYQRTRIHSVRRILEVGCGTGVITGELASVTDAQIFGLDIDHKMTSFAQSNDPASLYLTGAGELLPFAGASFDAVICHYLLLWASSPLDMLSEMVRCTRPGGWVFALAEPDYGGRVDHPAQLAEIGTFQAKALQEQGADPEIGRKLRGLFNRVGLHEVEVGVVGGEWRGSPEPEEIKSEWEVLSSDLGRLVPSDTLDAWSQMDQQAWEKGDRILFVPTFYAIGRVP